MISVPKQADTSERLVELAKILGQQTDFQEVLRLVAQKSAEYLEADLCLILVLNPDTRDTLKTAMKEGGSPASEDHRNVHIHVGGWIVTEGKSFTSGDIHRDKRFSAGLFKRVPYRTVLGTPLRIEGVVIGAVIALYEEANRSMQPEILGSLENLSAVAVPFLRNAEKIRRVFGPVLSDSTLAAKYESAGLFGRSPAFYELLKAIDAAARSDVRVLLDGRTGTGKELIARAIHTYSQRSDGPFVPVDCGAISPALIESELFGHAKGAFTNAHAERPGLFRQAHGGTVFLDEINNLPQELQPKLLRFLEGGEVRPVGSDETFTIDVRVIAASSVPLKRLVDEKTFREDLYYRLHVYPVLVPDLEQRRGDIAHLSCQFLRTFTAAQKKEANGFHEDVLELFKRRSWPGNIRELEHVIESIVTVLPADVDVVDRDMLPQPLQKELNEILLRRDPHVDGTPLKELIDNYEAEQIRTALERCGWNQSQAARILQTSEGNIRYKMAHLNIVRDT